MESTAPVFAFQYQEGKQFISIIGKDIQERFAKWSMKGRIQVQAFSFDQHFQSYQKNDFVLAFFQDPTVVRSLQTLSFNSKWLSIGTPANTVTVEEVPSTVISMEFFDRLYGANIARECGAICKCFDEFYDDFTISDNLRKMLLIEDSDHYDTFSEKDREEFLFLLFKHLCLGGSLCQYEDNVEPYLDATKAIYKELLNVQKDSSGVLHITSVVLKVSAHLSDGSIFYPCSCEPHTQTFCYLIVDPVRRHVYVLYHNFGNGEM